MKRLQFTVNSSRFTSYLFHVSCFMFALLIPTQFGKHFWPEYTYLHGVKIDYLAPFISIFDIVCIAIILQVVISTPRLWRGWRDLSRIKHGYLTPVTFTLVFIILNIVFSLSPLVTLFRIAKIFLYIAAGYYVIKGSFDKQEISPPNHFAHGVEMTREVSLSRLLIFGLFTSTLLVFILAVWQFATKSSVGGLWYFLGERNITLSLPGIAKMTYEGREFLRPYSTFSHPNSMGGFYLVLYFLIDWFRNTKNQQTILMSSSDSIRGSGDRFPIKLGMMLWTTQIVSLFLVILSFSKIAIGTFVFISFIKLFVDKSYKGCVICFAARISIFIFLLLFSFLFSGDPYTLDKRFFLTIQSLEIFKNNLLLGVGLGASLVAQSKLTGAIPGRFTDTLQPVHNIYLLFASEVGIVGIAFLTYIVFLKRKLFYHWQKLPVAAIFAILITGLFDHYWLTLSQNVALLCLVLIISANRLMQKPEV